MKWALVLSGGGARGFAHIGVIKALERRGYPRPALVCGASMGAIIGALYAQGWDSSKMEAYVRRFDIRNFIANPAFKLPSFALSRLIQAGTALGAMMRGKSLDPGAKVEAELYALFGDKRIEDLAIPFACTATDILSGRMVAQDSGSLVDAIRASMSFPGVFAPVERDGAVLVDGGVLNNMPCDIARDRGYRHILASDVSPFKDTTSSALDNGIAMLLRCFDVAAEHAQRATNELAELTITSSDGSQAFDFQHRDSIIALGERSADAMGAELDRFFLKGSSPMAVLIDTIMVWKRSRVR